MQIQLHALIDVICVALVVLVLGTSTMADPISDNDENGFNDRPKGGDCVRIKGNGYWPKIGS